MKTFGKRIFYNGCIFLFLFNYILINKVAAQVDPSIFMTIEESEGGEDVEAAQLDLKAQYIKQYLQDYGTGAVNQNITDEQILKLAKLLEKYTFTVEEQNAYATVQRTGYVSDAEEDFYNSALRKAQKYKRKVDNLYKKWYRQMVKISNKSISEEERKNRKLNQRKTKRIMQGKNPYRFYERLFNRSYRNPNNKWWQI